MIQVKNWDASRGNIASVGSCNSIPTVTYCYGIGDQSMVMLPRSTADSRVNEKKGTYFN